MNKPVFSSAQSGGRLVAGAGLEELRAFLDANPDVRFVDTLFVDVCGRLRGKRFPVEDAPRIFAEGMQIPITVYLLDVTGDQHDPGGYGYSDGDPDGTGFPIPGTLTRVPWAKTPHAQMLMSLFDSSGAPAQFEPRTILSNVLERFVPLGLKPVVAFELEFYLMDRKRAENGAPLPARAPLDGRAPAAHDAYGIGELERFEPFLSACHEAARIQKIPATTVSSELAPAQFEINLQHRDDALRAADEAALLRHLVSGVARSIGAEATFMAKPFNETSGSGMHIHLSLGRDGRNAFFDPQAVGSPLLLHALGGLQAVMGEAMAIFAPDLNAYRRYRPLNFVPMNRRWGINNRSCAFRIPAGGGEGRRIEIRAPAACANPYLVLAVILAGIHHGIVNQIDPGPPARGNAALDVDPTLPFELSRALDALANGQVLPSYLGQRYVDVYCSLKRAELAKFMDRISPAEYEWYL